MPPSGTGASNLRYPSLPIDFDVLFAAATRYGEHDSETDCNHDADHGPCRPDAGQNTQFPECGEKAANQDDVTKEIRTCPFHANPPKVKKRCILDLHFDAGNSCSLDADARRQSLLAENERISIILQLRVNNPAQNNGMKDSVRDRPGEFCGNSG
jgi:hypothetical protein